MRTKTFTDGNPYRLLFFFSLPLMFGNVFQQLYTVMDTMIVGQALGVNALAALGSADWPNWMCLGFIQGLTQGFAIRMAQNFGAADHEELKRTIGQSIQLSALLAVILMLFFQLSARPILLLLQTPAEILPDTLLYLRIMFLGIPIVITYNLLASMLRAVGDSKTPLTAMIIASLSNIVLDLLFVYGFHWGIAGAAIATLAAQSISVIYCLLTLRRVPLLHPAREHIQWNRALSVQLMLLGCPMAFQNFIISIGGMIVQSLVNTYGVLFIAGFTATNKLYGILEIAATSYGFAVVTYTGQNLGAGKIARIRRGLRAALVISMLTAATLCLLLLFFGRMLLSLFLSGTPEEIEEALNIAYHYLCIMSICLPVLYLLHVVRSTLQGLGNTMIPFLSGLAEFTMRTGCVLLLPLLLPKDGIFFAEVLAWLGADLVLVPGYFHEIRKTAQQLLPSPAPGGPKSTKQAPKDSNS